MTTLTAPLATLSLDTTATPALLTDLDATLAAVTAAPDAPTTCTFAPAPSPAPAAPKAHQRQLAKVMRAAKTTVAKRAKRRAMMGQTAPPPTLTHAERTARVQALRALPQPEQRSDAWYARRDQMVTASDFGKALKSEAACTTFAKQKAGPIRARDEAEAKGEVYVRPPRRSGGAACQHGVMFEPVCDSVYRHLCRPGAVTEEFGLLPHPTVAYLGASPDGICNEHSPAALVGRLVEYKAPISRPIVQGVVPDGYMAQMQGQLEVTGLDECDYLECALKVVDATDAKARAASAHPPAAYGLIVTHTPADATDPVYAYGPWNRVDDDAALTLLEDATIPDEADVLYWVLDEYQLATVRRNEAWWRDVLGPALAKVWAAVEVFSGRAEKPTPMTD